MQSSQSSTASSLTTVAEKQDNSAHAEKIHSN